MNKRIKELLKESNQFNGKELAEDENTAIITPVPYDAETPIAKVGIEIGALPFQLTAREIDLWVQEGIKGKSIQKEIEEQRKKKDEILKNIILEEYLKPYNK